MEALLTAVNGPAWISNAGVRNYLDENREVLRVARVQRDAL